jgi:hypothetical protein
MKKKKEGVQGWKVQGDLVFKIGLTCKGKTNEGEEEEPRRKGRRVEEIVRN